MAIPLKSIYTKKYNKFIDLLILVLNIRLFLFFFIYFMVYKKKFKNKYFLYDLKYLDYVANYLVLFKYKSLPIFNFIIYYCI